ncbi:MAG: alkaline phosphatase family protein [Deltaproteobacteria bacterium]|nr:alkaline phosphatase family protein [Deltaproteobacteria bacterium]
MSHAGLVAGLVWVLLGAGCRAPASEPRLVLLLVVDQLRADRLDPELPGGLGRLAREGRVFADAALDHAFTETCPGHVAASTGRHPGPVGVPGNEWVDAEAGERFYCVDDPSPEARTLGGSQGRSPHAIGATALGDWLKWAHPEAKVFSVSAKDRAAIGLGGQRPDAAYWLDRTEALGFTTSRWYREALPEWVERFNGKGASGFVAALPAEWQHATGSPANGARPDPHPREMDRFSATSPHPLAGAERAQTLERLSVTPYLDDVTLDFARALVSREGLGDDPVPDLLAVSLSAADLVGHYYGPWSQESRDALLRLDRSLGRFLDALEAQVGREGLVVALTSDHGVLALPEWLSESGLSNCPILGGRVDARGLLAALGTNLDEAFGVEGAEAGPWIHEAGTRFTVNDVRSRATGVPPDAILGRARRFFEAQPVVARVWTAAEIAAGDGPEPFASLYRNSHHPTRGGDMVVQTIPDCLVSPYSAGTSHGSPYRYDRAVPLVVAGAGVVPGVVRGRASVVDLAPTLAALLGIPTPGDLDGSALPLR